MNLKTQVAALEMLMNGNSNGSKISQTLTWQGKEPELRLLIEKSNAKELKEAESE